VLFEVIGRLPSMSRYPESEISETSDGSIYAQGALNLKITWVNWTVTIYIKGVLNLKITRGNRTAPHLCRECLNLNIT